MINKNYKTDLNFKIIVEGGDSPVDGLQIYKENDLIGDVDIPKGSKVKIYVEPYYYLEGVIDEENETISVFRFKI